MLSPPATAVEALDRIQRNGKYFSANYLILCGALLTSTVLLNPVCLLVLVAFAAGWLYVFAVRTEPIVINGRELSAREKMMAMSAASLAGLFLFTSVGYTMAYAVVMGGVISAAHGAMRMPVETFDDLEAPGKKSLLQQLTKA